MSDWIFTYSHFDPEKEGLREALCTLGNGFFATRGAAFESKTDEVHYPGTYLAGGYNRLVTNIAGRTIENEDLVNIPNWLSLSFCINEETCFQLSEVEILSFKQELDIRRGAFFRHITFKDKKGRETTVREHRIVHSVYEHLGALQVSITPDNWSGTIEFLSALDGRVVNAGVSRYKDLNNKHLEPIAASEIDDESVCLEVCTTQSKLRIAQCARTRILINDESVQPKMVLVQDEGYIGHRFRVEVNEGDTCVIEKVVSIYTSRDNGISECGLAAQKALCGIENFACLLSSHELGWEHLWRRFEIDYTSQSEQEELSTGLIIHLYMFHLLQTTSRHSMDLDVGIPARGWHGEAYRGHIFWDELFVFPLFNLRIPQLTRALLMYRFRRLGEARCAAHRVGYKGAMFPWQSGSSGRDETQKVHLNPKSNRWILDHSHLQRHVNAAIAYNLWQYYQASGDIEFMSSYGTEVFLEIARFLASLTSYNKDLKRFEILKVMGPDEYHDAYPDSDEPGLNNNTYTNIMVVWVLSRAIDLLGMLGDAEKKEVCEKLNLLEEEIENWKQISKEMLVIFHSDGIVSQFEGYEQLQEFDWDGYREKYGDIQRLDRILEAEGDSPNRYKASKQADVLMLFYLFSADELCGLFAQLGYDLCPEHIPKNIEYYLHRTSHGSTLSRVVHSWVLARSDRRGSWKFFVQALESDVADIQGGTTPEGIHLGAMAGTIDILQRAYTGIEMRKDVLRFDPHLPEGLGEMAMSFRYRGNSLDVKITQENLNVTILECEASPIKIGFRDEVIEPEKGKSYSFALSNK